MSQGLAGFLMDATTQPPAQPLSFVVEMKLVRQESLWGSIYWTLHAWFKGYHIPTDRGTWSYDSIMNESQELRLQALVNTTKRWTELAPFFASCGYQLYRSIAYWTTEPACGSKRCSPAEHTYPYARQTDLMTDDKAFTFSKIQGFRVWAARDKQGREVIIKLVSYPGEETDELKIYRRLNTLAARKDPRNHTLPVLDYIRYNGLTFVVTPRWGSPVTGTNWGNAEEILYFADTMLEAVAFLHENRIAHRDILLMNTVVDVLNPQGSIPERKVGILDPSIARYALIDYDASAIFPMDADIDDVLIERAMRIGACSVGLTSGLSNPFKDDVLVLLRMLQTYVRVLEKRLPQLGSFFDTYMADLVNPPSASDLLQKFREMTSGFERTELSYVPTITVWRSAEDYERLKNRRKKSQLSP